MQANLVTTDMRDWAFLAWATSLGMIRYRLWPPAACPAQESFHSSPTMDGPVHARPTDGSMKTLFSSGAVRTESTR